MVHSECKRNGFSLFQQDCEPTSNRLGTYNALKFISLFYFLFLSKRPQTWSWQDNFKRKRMRPTMQSKNRKKFSSNSSQAHLEVHNCSNRLSSAHPVNRLLAVTPLLATEEERKVDTINIIEVIGTSGTPHHHGLVSFLFVILLWKKQLKVALNL